MVKLLLCTRFMIYIFFYFGGFENQVWWTQAKLRLALICIKKYSITFTIDKIQICDKIVPNSDKDELY